ncbi:MAG TPA: hydroxymethylpyrimidine/phosphomethylpyrimidine kinase [Sedimenticola sp.]|nr:hydroxymethylpyrimidine/phosphomethylpyrimidine kinase [Sedimenticola sp.]
MPSPTPPVVLSLSGHDPTGGAGIQADIEAISAQGCIATTVVTCLTVQDTENVHRLAPVAPDLVTAQGRTLLADIRVQAFKVGLLGSAEIAGAVAGLLRAHPDIPVVLDPVLAAGGGAGLADAALLDAIRSRLLPLATLVTPNSVEARRITGGDTPGACADRLLAYGCGAALITGGHEREPRVRNRLYRPGLPVVTHDWPRLPGGYHGSGCTLAASVAALLARGLDLEPAVAAAQESTWQSLSRARRPGRGQMLPCRIAPCAGEDGA